MIIILQTVTAQAPAASKLARERHRRLWWHTAHRSRHCGTPRYRPALRPTPSCLTRARRELAFNPDTADACCRGCTLVSSSYPGRHDTHRGFCYQLKKRRSRPSLFKGDSAQTYRQPRTVLAVSPLRSPMFYNLAGYAWLKSKEAFITTELMPYMASQRQRASDNPVMRSSFSVQDLTCAHALVDHAAIVTCRVAEQSRASVCQARPRHSLGMLPARGSTAASKITMRTSTG